MHVIDTELGGLRLVEPEVHGDDRGFFIESYRRDRHAALGIDVDFVQDNHSRSRRGTLRGLHFQTFPGQAKLIRCARGAIRDVVVDLRRSSATFGRHEAFVLDDVHHRQLYVPIGFAHGFVVLSDAADVCYKVSSVYEPTTEAGLAWDDPELGIDWGMGEPVVSDRDRNNPSLESLTPSLPRW